mgnify:CR=1 FL=1
MNNVDSEERRLARLRQWAKDRRRKDLDYSNALKKEIDDIRKQNAKIKEEINSLYAELVHLLSPSW